MSLFKKIKVTIALIVVSFILTIPVFADEIEQLNLINRKSITPYFTYISSFSSDLNVSSDGRYDISVFVSSRNCDYIVIRGFLQRFENSSWKTIKNWSINQKRTVAVLNERYYVTKGYQYRLQSNCEIYNQNNLIESEKMITAIEFY